MCRSRPLPEQRPASQSQGRPFPPLDQVEVSRVRNLTAAETAQRPRRSLHHSYPAMPPATVMRHRPPPRTGPAMSDRAPLRPMRHVTASRPTAGDPALARQAQPPHLRARVCRRRPHPRSPRPLRPEGF